MTRKHFEAIAGLIKVQIETVSHDPLIGSVERDTLATTAKGLAAEFAAFNPGFKAGRFLAACGVTG